MATSPERLPQAVYLNHPYLVLQAVCGEPVAPVPAQRFLEASECSSILVTRPPRASFLLLRLRLPFDLIYTLAGKVQDLGHIDYFFLKHRASHCI